MAQTRRRKSQDPVIGLISGKMVPRKVTDAYGNTTLVMIFQPFRRNPNPTLHELRKIKSHRTEDDIMSFERLRHLPVSINRDEFAKSDSEKAQLKKAIKEHKSTLVKAGVNPNLQLNISFPMVLNSFKDLKRA